MNIDMERAKDLAGAVIASAFAEMGGRRDIRPEQKIYNWEKFIKQTIWADFFDIDKDAIIGAMRRKIYNETEGE